MESAIQPKSPLYVVFFSLKVILAPPLSAHGAPGPSQASVKPMRYHVNGFNRRAFAQYTISGDTTTDFYLSTVLKVMIPLS